MKNKLTQKEIEELKKPIKRGEILRKKIREIIKNTQILNKKKTLEMLKTFDNLLIISLDFLNKTLLKYHYSTTE